MRQDYPPLSVHTKRDWIALSTRWRREYPLVVFLLCNQTANSSTNSAPIRRSPTVQQDTLRTLAAIQPQCIGACSQPCLFVP